MKSIAQEYSENYSQYKVMAEEYTRKYAMRKKPQAE